jgi:hypothetical protein
VLLGFIECALPDEEVTLHLPGVDLEHRLD